MNTHSLMIVIFAACFAIITCDGCGKKIADEPTKYRSQAGLEKLTLQAQAVSEDNRAFFSSKDSTAKAPEVKVLDVNLRPALKKVFGDAKITAESNSPQTKSDGEVVENRFVYSVKKRMVPEDGKALHAALLSSGFSTSPRLGSKPTIWKGGAVMSLFRSTPQRTYSLQVAIDTKKQQIVVESYRLGSKYDRLM